MDQDAQLNRMLGWIAAIFTFVGIWLFFALNYSTSVGIIMGWIPAAIGAILAGGVVVMFGKWALAFLGACAVLSFAAFVYVGL